MPVLALGGERSLGPLVGATFQVVASEVRAEVVSECGHYIPEEQPDYLAVRLRLLAFFDEEGQGGRHRNGSAALGGSGKARRLADKVPSTTERGLLKSPAEIAPAAEMANVTSSGT